MSVLVAPGIGFHLAILEVPVAPKAIMPRIYPSIHAGSVEGFKTRMLVLVRPSLGVLRAAAVSLALISPSFCRPVPLGGSLALPPPQSYPFILKGASRSLLTLSGKQSLDDVPFVVRNWATFEATLPPFPAPIVSVI